MLVRFLFLMLPGLGWAADGLVDADSESIRATARELTRDHADDRSKARAIHDFVRDQILFGWDGSFYAMKASEVLAARVGYCNTKGTLFVALLRAAGLSARQRFVSLDARILQGLLERDRAYVDHSFVEVLLEGRWVRVDSYIVDRPLFDRAQARLKAEGKLLGYGVHAHGVCEWDGRSDAFSQFVDDGAVPQLTHRDYGVHADTLALYRAVDGDDELAAPVRWVFPWLIRGANERVRALRAEVSPARHP